MSEKRERASWAARRLWPMARRGKGRLWPWPGEGSGASWAGVLRLQLASACWALQKEEGGGMGRIREEREEKCQQERRWVAGPRREGIQRILRRIQRRELKGNYQ